MPPTTSSIRLGATDFVILEPDIIVDVTEAAAAVRHNSPPSFDIVLARRFERRIPTISTLVGAMVNEAVDILITSPDIKDNELWERMYAEHRYAIVIARDTSISERTVQDMVMARFSTLRRQTDLWKGHNVVVEQAIISPKIGLQGRLDIVVENAGRLDLLELKSGKRSSTSADQYRAQLAAYALLFDLADLGDRGRTALWYSGEPDSAAAFEDITDLAEWQRRLLEARNMIVERDLEITRRRSGPFQNINSRAGNLATHQRTALANLHDGFASLNATEKLVFRAWMAFLTAESDAQRRGDQTGRSMASLWRLTVDEKRSEPTTLTDLRLVAIDEERRHIELEQSKTITDTLSALRVGDQILLVHASELNNTDAIVVRRGNITSISPPTSRRGTVVTLSLLGPLSPLAQNSGWILEADSGDSLTKRTTSALAEWISQSRTDVRRRLLGMLPPRTRQATSVLTDGLHPEQADVVRAALESNDWFLIQGPPGTGKTSTVIRALVTSLVADPGERILLLAWTNRATDELMDMVHRAGLSDRAIRLTGKSGARRPRTLRQIFSDHEPDEAEQIVRTAPIVVSTISSIISQPSIFTFGRFTTAIVDEASQVLEPVLAGVLAHTNRSILVGDANQLPAVVLQAEEHRVVDHADLENIGMYRLDTSLFERLQELAHRRGWTQVLGRLHRQGRMHQDIQNVASAMFYDGRLDVCHDRQTASSTLYGFPSRATAINVIGTVQDHGRAAAKLAWDLAHRFPNQSIGVISPFRAQNNLILSALAEKGSDVLDRVTVDTVERFQGSERDIIVFVPSVTTPSELDTIISDVVVEGRHVDRKLNVAITRAREQLIILGDLSVLRNSDIYARMLSMLSVSYLDVLERVQSERVQQ
ncbi:MAG TPA: hypothetical protein DIS79_06680 [Bacteroidetes bacterium]|nr:hypothetical protein [Bacteroidota bacterium]HRK04804.1 AAA domain-containing protein [Chlorobiota bacterium]